jgi:POT family proton-dependent oligopeptide transporter
MVLGLIIFRWGAKFLGDAGLKSIELQGDAKSNSKTLSKAGIWMASSIALLAIVHLTGLYPITVTGLSNLMGILLIVVPFVYFFFLFTTGGFDSGEKKRIVAIIVFYLAAALFWGAFEQAGSTLTLFADRNTANSVFGFEFHLRCGNLLILCGYYYYPEYLLSFG